MKTTGILFFGILLLSSLSWAQPRIEIEGGNNFDYGDVYRGQKVDRELSVKNVGNQTLVIERVEAPCGCTGTLLSDRNVAPGETAKLKISFDSKNFTGKVFRDAFVHSNDPENPRAHIRFGANVVQVLEANPNYFYFQVGKVDSTMTTSVKLKNVSDQPIRILEVKTEAPRTKFDLTKRALQPGEETDVKLTYTPVRLGHVSQDVIVRTNHPKQPEIALKLMCNVRLAQ